MPPVVFKPTPHQAAADPRLIPRGHCDRPGHIIFITYIKMSNVPFILVCLLKKIQYMDKHVKGQAFSGFLPINFTAIYLAEAETGLFYIRKVFSLNFGRDTNYTD
jgi:hypothetical protein